MNKIQRMRNRPKFLNLVKTMKRQHISCFRFNTGNTKEHELKKLQICWELKEKGHRFMTEAELQNGLRVDILDLDTGDVFEIINTSPTSVQKKAKLVQSGFKVYDILCKSKEKNIKE